MTKLLQLLFFLLAWSSFNLAVDSINELPAAQSTDDADHRNLQEQVLQPPALPRITPSRNFRKNFQTAETSQNNQLTNHPKPVMTLMTVRNGVVTPMETKPQTVGGVPASAVSQQTNNLGQRVSPTVHYPNSQNLRVNRSPPTQGFSPDAIQALQVGQASKPIQTVQYSANSQTVTTTLQHPSSGHLKQALPINQLQPNTVTVFANVQNPNGGIPVTPQTGNPAQNSAQNHQQRPPIPRRANFPSRQHNNSAAAARTVRPRSRQQKPENQEPEPFGKHISSMMRGNPLYIAKQPETTLTCEFNGGRGYSISSRIKVDVLPLANTSFSPTEICVYDYKNRCHSKSYLNVATNVSHVCTFRMRDMIVTKRGALIEGSEPRRPLSFGHETMVGGKDPQYAPVMAYMFLKGHDLAYFDYPHEKTRPNSAEVTVPGKLVSLRSRFDDCFNHQSFQSLPLIALVYEFHRELFHSVYWQASKHTAAMLQLLDVPLEKIVVERPAKVEEILLPWVPYWNPIQLPTLFGIAGNIEERMTQRLLSMKFGPHETNGTEPLRVLNHQYRTIGFAGNMTLSQGKKYIVYLSRPEDMRRGVVNETELLQALVDWKSEEYELLVLPSTRAFTKFEHMFVVWQQYARIISRAKVLAGPHGGAMNNMIWAPRDCELVEFNELPDEDFFLESHNQVPVRFPFLAGWWAKGGGKYWNIEASLKHPQNFYEGRIKVSVREWLEVLKQVDGGRLLRTNEIDWSRYPFEKHGCFTEDRKTSFSHCGDEPAPVRQPIPESPEA